MKTVKGYRKLIKHYNIQGQGHYLTFSCHQNEAYLSKDRTRNWFIESLHQAREKHKFELWGWVTMPNHVHLLILPQHDSKIYEILNSIKQPVARKANNWLRKQTCSSGLEHATRPGDHIIRFWQRGTGYDRNIYSVEEIYETLNYLHHNPVRGGLAKLPNEWRWSSCRAYEFGIDEPLDVNRDSLPPMTSSLKKAIYTRCVLVQGKSCQMISGTV